MPKLLIALRLLNSVGLAVLLGLMIGTSSSALASYGIELTTDFHFSSHISRRMPGEATGADGLTQNDLAFSYRVRGYLELMKRKGRTLRLLLGPYIRITSIVFPKNYGINISNPFAYEFGGEIGFSWFGVIKTVFTASPNWTFSYTTTDQFTSPGRGPDKPMKLSYQHWSAGIRVEIPIYTLSSTPDDRRAEFGVLAVYQLDRIEKISFAPNGFTPDGSEGFNTTQTLSFTQQIGQRWQAGFFMTLRL